MASFYPGLPPIGSYAAPAGYPTWAPHHIPPVHNPGLPYLGDIRGGLKPGMMIHVHGSIPHHADRFYVNLQVGSSTQPRADIALHVNPRIQARQTVLNAMRNQQWGAEQRPGGVFPFRPGKRFEMIILAEHHGYKIAVNGMHYVEFRHSIQIPLHSVNTLNIGGSANVSFVSIDQPGSASNHIVEPVRRPQIPYFMNIPGGMSHGRMIVFNGYVNPDADKFIVNIQQGRSDAPHNIALHFNPRFAAQSVVMNAKNNNRYGSEMVGSSFPFYRNRPFEMIILCETGRFRIAVNGHHFADFPHRIPIHHANHVAVFGNVRVNHIRIM